MSPIVFRAGAYRYYFFSKEETRRHVHVIGPDGEAKVWLEPAIELASSAGLSSQNLRDIIRVVEARQEEIQDEWNRHFGS